MTTLSLKLTVAVITFMIGVGSAALWLRRSLWLHSSRTIQLESSIQSAEAEKTEEYAVYSAVIRKIFIEDGVKLLVIQNRTLFYANPDYLKSTSAEERIQDMKRYCQSVDESALRDFEAKHMRPAELTPNFDLPLSYVLVSRDSFDDTSEEKARFVIRDFYRKYPDTRGLISLSRVGFNKDRSQAFLRVEFTFCPLCGHGEKVLLKKEAGSWIVVDTFGGWAS